MNFGKSLIAAAFIGNATSTPVVAPTAESWSELAKTYGRIRGVDPMIVEAAYWCAENIDKHQKACQDHLMSF